MKYKGLQTPSGAQIMPSMTAIAVSGEKDAPPASAVSQSLSLTALTARATATSDDEQAHATVSAGPRRSRWYAIVVAT